MSTTKTKQNTNANQQPKPNANTHKQSETQNSEMNNPGRSTQNNITNRPENGNWTTQTGKRNLSSTSSSSSTSKTSSTKTAQPQTKKLFFSTRNRYEPLLITEPIDSVFDVDMIAENPEITPRVKPPPPIFMKGINDFPGFCTTLIEFDRS